jgi:hypothetical protein
MTDSHYLRRNLNELKGKEESESIFCSSVQETIYPEARDHLDCSGS